MAYQKRPLVARICAHCSESYQAVDRRRLYCSASCKVQACKVRRRVPTALPTPSPTSLAAAPVPVPPLTLDWSLQNMAVLGTASALGQLGIKLGEKVVKALTSPSKPVSASVEVMQPVNPLNWLPAGLLTAAAPRVQLQVHASGQTLPFIELNYLGHKLYYQPTNNWLLWGIEPGKLVALLSPEHVAIVAEQMPANYYAPAPALPSYSSGACQLKDLG